ncbi:MAG: hypothetical protein LBD94_00860, partial [Rickettsiales bacterium]|nr:hypothetical protein [Rickettsiales bacterium]
MKSGRFFWPPMVAAIVFALCVFAPVSGFAADAKEVAKVDYMSRVKSLIEKYKNNQNVKKGVLDSILSQTEANSGKTYSSEDVADLKEEAEAAKEKEQSTANKMLSGLSMAATG